MFFEWGKGAGGRVKEGRVCLPNTATRSSLPPLHLYKVATIDLWAFIMVDNKPTLQRWYMRDKANTPPPPPPLYTETLNQQN